MPVAASETRVTPDTFIRAESDQYFNRISQQAGGVNQLFHFRRVTPLDQQTVVRMNRDTLYSMGIVDTAEGATVTMPPIPAGRYASIYLVDNDHYVPFVIYDHGTHELPRDTRYLGIGVRIQIFDPHDPDEIALVNKLQDGFTISAGSAEAFEPPTWDQDSLNELRAEYEKEFQTYDRWPADWQGPRDNVNEATRHLAAAGAWGLFPVQDATYIGYSGHHDPAVCHSATYETPENDAFWSITVYGADGYMKSDNNIVNSSNAVKNADGTATVHFGSTDVCGDVPNRLDVSDGWNFLMRVYRPGPTVLDGTYKLPQAEPTSR